MLLKRDKISARACSATACLFPSGALMQYIFFDFAYLTSIFSNPEPALAINFKFFAFFKNKSSILNLLLITKPSYLLIFFSISFLDLSNAFTHLYPFLINFSCKNECTLSTKRIFIVKLFDLLKNKLINPICR